MKFFKKKSNIIIAAIIVVIIGAVVFINQSSNGVAQTLTNYTQLEKGELVSSINVKGIVKSESNESVYSTLGYQVTKVNVEVGDRVIAGQQLMELDTDELRSSINERKSMLGKSSESSLVQLENSKRQYNEAVQNYSTGQDSSLVSAKSRITTAGNSLENAQKNYNDKVKEYDDRENGQLISAESTLRNAEIDLEKLEDDFKKSKILFDAGTISKDEYEKKEQSIATIKNTITDAKKNIDTTLNGMDTEISSLKQVLDTAQINYDEAVDSLNTTEITVKQGVDKYQDSVKTAEVSINTDSDLVAIQNLETKLAKAHVTSPISGTVTAVFAKEGSTASGLMFVIEDTDSLKIDTKIKEFDSTKVKEGMEVLIKSDATGDDVYDGKIKKIAPTSVKDAQGQSSSLSDVEFEIEISVLPQETDLKIGMNAKLTIVLEKRENVIFVPFDAIGVNDNDQDIVYIIETVASETKAKEVPIKILFENDFYAQIEGDGIIEGAKIVTDSSSITKDGMLISIESEVKNEENN